MRLAPKRPPQICVRLVGPARSRQSRMWPAWLTRPTAARNAVRTDL